MPKILNLDIDKIVNLYVNERKSTREIGRILDVSSNTINKKLRELNIKIRDCRIDLDLNKIKDLYINKKKTMKEIGKLMNVGGTTILKRLKKMNVKRRKDGKKINLDLEKIKDLYVNKQKSIRGISKILKVSIQPIRDRLIGMNIKIRKNIGGGKNKLDLDINKIKDLYINQKISCEEIGRFFNTSGATILRRLRRIGVKIRPMKLDLDLEKIKDLYINQKKTSTEIGKIIGAGGDTILNKLEKMNIKKREHPSLETEFKKGQKMPRAWIEKRGSYGGKNNPNWKNGSSFDPYGKEFNDKLKKQIRKRDNHTCQECGKHQKEFKSKLPIHHIDFNKKNNNPFNLISLCKKCHPKTNSNRKHWMRYFKNIMALREIFNPENLLIFDEKTKGLIGMERIK